LDGLPQLDDVVVDRARRREDVVAPDLVEELVPRDDLARVLDEVLQDLELARGEVELDALAGRLEGLEVDVDVAPARLLPGARRLGAAEDGLDARHELDDGEGLG